MSKLSVVRVVSGKLRSHWDDIISGRHHKHHADPPAWESCQNRDHKDGDAVSKRTQRDWE